MLFRLISLSLHFATAALPLADLQADLNQVRAGSFPSLANYDIRLDAFESAEDFFKSTPQVSTLMKNAKDRIYLVQYNRRVLQSPPDRDAIRAIIAHELKHILDYTKMTTLGTAQFAATYGLFSTARYEHATDLYALKLGYGAGLRKYRTWLYTQVSAATQKAKEETYYTPAQIDIWMQTGKETP